MKQVYRPDAYSTNSYTIIAIYYLPAKGSFFTFRKMNYPNPQK